MGLLEWAMRFFRSVAPETLRHLEDDEATAKEARLIREIKLMRDERDVYRRELLRQGYRELYLATLVRTYRANLLTEVRKAS